MSVRGRLEGKKPPSRRRVAATGGHGHPTGPDADDGEHGREWLAGLPAGLAEDGLVEVSDDDRLVARLRR